MEIEQQLMWEKIKEKTGFSHFLLLSYNSGKFEENMSKGIYDLQGFYRHELFNLLRKYILTKDSEYVKDGTIFTNYNCEKRLKEIIDFNFFNRSLEVNTCIVQKYPFRGPIKDRTEYMGMKEGLDFVSFFVEPDSEIFRDFMMSNTAFPLSDLEGAEADSIVDKKIEAEKVFNKHILFCTPEKEDDMADLVEILTGFSILRSDFNEDDFSMKFARVV